MSFNFFATFFLKIVIEGNPVTVHPGIQVCNAFKNNVLLMATGGKKKTLMKHFQSIILHFNLKCQQGSNDSATNGK